MRAPETEFEDLEALLREDRPAPEPAWARALDAKVAAGFPRARRRRSWLPAIGLNQALAVAACGLLAVVIGVAVLNAGGRGDDSGAGGGFAGEPALDPSGGAGGGAAAGSSGAAGAEAD